ncbi:hypothetical protein E4T44_01992 [Aureobasidium sp. EXF-8845]|nr:hypothetical protein E4T44_01992 [Aureobasidium sp. EXF-8845]KAI4858114.1 hypothetical protein E4T45_00368 [Aureobasidium sp. EXF-8846]
MEAYGLVTADPSWTWVVEKQCFVSWTDNDEGPKCLGKLSPRNSTVKLTINIGWCADSKELLMVLHLPIFSRGSKHARDMFMIIPNNFDTSRLDTTFAPVQLPGRADLDNAGFAYCHLFHIPVTVAEPCDVIMPQTQRQKPLKVSNLKSLSESRAFDIYCRFDTFAQVELRKIFAKINQFEIPPLLLDSMYDGRGAGGNLWHHQGLDLTPNGEERCKITQQDSGLPPRYTSHITPPPVDVQVPRSDVVVDPVSKDTDREGVPESPFWVNMRRILDYKSPQWEAAQRVNEKRPASVEPLSDQRRTKRIGICRTPLIGSPIRESRALTTELDYVFFDSQHDASPRSEKSEEISSPLIAATPASLPPQSDEKTVAVQHDPSLSVDRSEEIAHWLYSAWKVLPSAHHTLRSRLLALGAAKSNISFATLRIDISTALAFTAARTPVKEPEPPLLTASDAEAQIREVVTWMNDVKSDADSILMQHLVALAGAAMRVIEVGNGYGRQEEMDLFLVTKAKCIALACVIESAMTVA